MVTQSPTIVPNFIVLKREQFVRVVPSLNSECTVLHLITFHLYIETVSRRFETGRIDTPNFSIANPRQAGRTLTKTVSRRPPAVIFLHAESRVVRHEKNPSSLVTTRKKPSSDKIYKPRIGTKIPKVASSRNMRGENNAK